MNFEEIIFKSPPVGCGYIYHILNSYDEIIYIGQTRNIYSRIGSHSRTKDNIYKIRYWPCLFEELSNREADEIIKFDPILNSSLPTNDFWFSLESHKKIYPILKGKTSRIRKILQKNNIRFFKGVYLHKDHIELILKELCGGAL